MTDGGQAGKRMDDHDLATQIDLASTELLQLMPALADALEKDGGTSSDAKVATSRAPAQPVNPVVLEAIATLTVEVPAVDVEARSRLEPSRNTPQARDVTTCISATAALFKRLDATDPGYARRYASHVFAWQRLARRAIGLSRPAAPIGHNCPRHDQPVTPLLAAGDEGTLCHGRRGAREAIVWRRGSTIFCPDCKAQWVPSEWPFLGRLLVAGDSR